MRKLISIITLTIMLFTTLMLPASAASHDPAEPTVLTLNEAYSSNAYYGDEYYTFTLDEKSDVNIWLGRVAINHTYTMTLSGNDIEPISTSDSSDDALEIETVLDAGTYYIELDSCFGGKLTRTEPDETWYEIIVNAAPVNTDNNNESNVTVKVIDVTNFTITDDGKPLTWTPSFTLTADLSENMVQDTSIKYQLGNTENMIEGVSNYAGMFFSKAIIGDTFDILEINNPEYEVFGAGLESYIAQLSEGGEYGIQWDGSKWVKSAVSYADIYSSNLIKDVEISIIDGYDLSNIDLIKNNIYDNIECWYYDNKIAIEDAKEDIEFYYTDNNENEQELTADAINSFEAGRKEIIVKYRGEVPADGKCMLNICTNSDFIQVSGGGYHSLALKDDGTVWAWGNNDYGQLGTGNNIESYVPQKVSGLTGVIEISTRGDHNMALKDDGTVWAWGLNNYGQLGIGNLENSNVPVKVNGISNIKSISAGHLFSLAVDNNGEVYSWGNCKNGQLGIGSFYAFFAAPQKINKLKNITQVSAGHYHALALDSDGVAWAWGKNSHGQLGDGTTNDSSEPIKACERILSVCAGLDNSFFAIDNTDGDYFAPMLVCGYNNEGQLGVGNNSPVYKLTEVATIKNGVADEYFYLLRNISSNSATLMCSGGVDMAGMNYYGQFGNGNNRYRICYFETQFEKIDNNYVDFVSVGGGHSLMLADGKIYCSGLNNHGQCGINTNGQNINVFMTVNK